jgi:hypothetical protein
MPLIPETAPEKVIEAFASLLKAEPYLFAEHITDLSELIANFPDDVSAIALSLKTWCEQRSEIFEALEDNFSHRGQSGFIPRSSKKYKELLQNAIRQSFPTSSSQQSDFNSSTQQFDSHSPTQQSDSNYQHNSIDSSH